MASPEPSRRQHSSSTSTPSQVIAAPIGLDTILQQKQQKTIHRGVNFNVMIVGETGCGKSTFTNTLFSGHLVDSKAATKSGEAPRKTTEIIETTHVLEEKGLKLNLTIIDTPGMGDTMNSNASWEPISKYIRDRNGDYLRKELNPQRERLIPDTRVHCVLYFLNPNGLHIKREDLCAMKAISSTANLIPVLSKSDTLTKEEKDAMKAHIRTTLDRFEIPFYPPSQPFDDDLIQHELNKQMKTYVPFAVVGSERSIVIDGKAVRGRRNRWGGMISIDNAAHSDTPILRDFLIRNCMNDLLESTSGLHYETFRRKQLMALKEGR